MARTISAPNGDNGVTIINARDANNVPGRDGRQLTISTVSSNSRLFVENDPRDGHMEVGLGSGNDTLVAKYMPWATDTGRSDLAFGDVAMGGGNDLVDFDRAAVRNVLDMGAGSDTLLLHNSYARDVRMGSGDDRVRVTSDADAVSDEELSAKSSALTRNNFVSLDGGVGGDDSLMLGQTWTISLDGSQRFTLQGGILRQTLAWNEASLVTGMPSDMSGWVDYPIYERNPTLTLKPRVRFTNFDHIGAICFVAGTMVETDHGRVAIETLKPGDMVRTRHGLQPLKWLGRRRLDIVDLSANSRLLPVRIPAGAFGHNLPETDLLFSPQHRVVVRSNIAERMFGAAEVLVQVKQLVGTHGIEVAGDTREVTYVHVMFDMHTTLEVGGIEAETLYLGREAVKALSDEARTELRSLFPGLMAAAAAGGEQDPVLPLIKGREVRALAARHARNTQPLYERAG